MKAFKKVAAPAALVLIAGIVNSASASAAEPTNWSVKGKPLSAGETRAMKLKSSGPVKVLVGQGAPGSFSIVCKKSQGAALIQGAKDSGSFGTGELTQLSLSKCGVEGQPGCEASGALRKIELKVETDGELLHPTTWTIKIELIIDLTARAKPKQTCSLEGNHELSGVADSNGPHNQQTEFPSPPLSSTTLLFDGHPAEFVAKYKLKAKGGPLSFG